MAIIYMVENGLFLELCDPIATKDWTRFGANPTWTLKQFYSVDTDCRAFVWQLLRENQKKF